MHEQARPIDILYIKEDDLYEMRKNQRAVSRILVEYFQMLPTDFPERLALLNSSLYSRQIKIYLFLLGKSRTPNFSGDKYIADIFLLPIFFCSIFHFTEREWNFPFHSQMLSFFYQNQVSWNTIENCLCWEKQNQSKPFFSSEASHCNIP